MDRQSRNGEEEMQMPVIEPMPREHMHPADLERMESMSPLIANSDYVRILAHNREVLNSFLDAPVHGPPGLLGGKLREILRIRSAQLGGCAACNEVRYDDSVDDVVNECSVLTTGLGPREARAVDYLERMHRDHMSIDADYYRALGEHFTVAEILELGMLCAKLVGAHRFVHTLDLLGSEPPVFPYRNAAAAVQSADAVSR
jgi:alkylhydroperoxidase family enzyme